jgi:low temperature requirement protein LtrA
MARYARPRDGEEQKATSLELFYDLVFVFAITQLSHHLLEHLDWAGVGQSALLLAVVWWSWNYTTWVTNELDPESPVVRGLMIALMLASLLMAVAIPEAFGDRALLFVLAYLAIQVGRHAFLAFVAADRGSAERLRAAHILTWFCLAGVFWVAGALADGTMRTALWVIAFLVDYGAPLAFYQVPWLPRSRGSDWEVETGHFSERFGLFVIIALGESIVITGATASGLELDLATALAFAVAFLGTAALWWLYFTYVQRIAAVRLEQAREDRTTLARDAYTYLHVMLVAAIIVSAVGDELVLAHPRDPAETSWEVAAVVGGPALYLLAHTAFRWRLTRTTGWRRPAGAAACVAIGLLLPGADLLVLAGLCLLVLVAVIAGDERSGVMRRRRGEASPLERLQGAAA